MELVWYTTRFPTEIQKQVWYLSYLIELFEKNKSNFYKFLNM